MNGGIKCLIHLVHSGNTQYFEVDMIDPVCSVHHPIIKRIFIIFLNHLLDNYI